MRTLRVLTLNIGSVLEPDWDRRPHEIAAGIVALAPDVVCLQEVAESGSRPNSAGQIVGLLAQAGEEWQWAFGGLSPKGPPFPIDTEPDLLFGSAVLSRWPIDESNLHSLPVLPGDRSAASVDWELFHTRTAGLDLFSTHLAAAPTHAPHRLAQVVKIDELIREARGTRDDPLFGAERATMPPILCGDFNAEPDSDEIRFLTSLHVVGDRAAFYQDAWRVAGDGTAGITNDWSTNPIAASLNVHRKRIDYVFVGDPFLRRGGGGRVISAEVVFVEPFTDIVASDHAGVIADIAWPED